MHLRTRAICDNSALISQSLVEAGVLSIRFFTKMKHNVKLLVGSRRCRPARTTNYKVVANAERFRVLNPVLPARSITGYVRLSVHFLDILALYQMYIYTPASVDHIQ